MVRYGLCRTRESLSVSYCHCGGYFSSTTNLHDFEELFEADMDAKLMSLTSNKLSDMLFLENRLKTFKKWPYDENATCTSQKMADAGFYVMSPNKPDTVICAFCLLELDGWEPEDNPWEEHCKREKSHSLDCAYLKLKGKPEKEWTVADFYGLAVARQVTLARAQAMELIKKVEVKAEATMQEMMAAKRKKR
uniref:Uncharacterized protein n=1 Tax=Plectus sambesii TaxID=2011161 RepID=A0A914VR30_9BILA